MSDPPVSWPAVVSAWPSSRRQGLEGQRARVDAVALTGRGRPVPENMAEMPTAAAAADLGAAHEQAAVRPQLDGLRDSRLVEARPAGTGFELGVRAEQLTPAARAAVGAVFIVMDVRTGERPLRAAPAQHAVLLFGQVPPPLLVGLLDLSR